MPHPLHASLLLTLGLLAGTAHAGTIDLQLSGVDTEVPSTMKFEVRSAITRMHAWYGDQLGLTFPPRVVVQVRLIANRATYDALARNYVHETSVGFFAPEAGGVMWAQPTQAATEGTLVHETSHYLLDEAGVRPPKWVNEGLAEVFERFRVAGNAVYVDPDPRVLAWLRGGGGMSVERLLRMGDGDWGGLADGPLGRAPHSNGYALVAFLVTSPAGKRTLAEIIRRYDGSRSTAEVVAAVEDTWRGGVRQLELDWRAWWSGRPAPVQLPVATGAERVVEASADAADPCPGGIMIRRGSETVCSN